MSFINTLQSCSFKGNDPKELNISLKRELMIPEESMEIKAPHDFETKYLCVYAG